MRQDGKSTVNTDFELASFALKDEEMSNLARPSGGVRQPHRLHGRFLRGPVPLAWLKQAASLPHRAVALGLVLWREEPTQGSPVRIVLGKVGMGLSQRTAKRALAALEGAGLVTVQRLPGRGVDVVLPEERGGAFLRGPIPWDWLERAATQSGKALEVGLSLRYLAGLTKRMTVRLCQSRVGFGLSEQAARRGLRGLEVAGLVSVMRKPGSALIVTLVELVDGFRSSSTYK
jgi:DNA-binding transcriptional ArsR family regulator